MVLHTRIVDLTLSPRSVALTLPEDRITMPTNRVVKEGKQIQGTDEVIVYTITSTPWGTPPVVVAATATKAYDVTDNNRTDVTATVLTGDTTVGGDVISLPPLDALTAGHIYRIEVKFTSGGNTFEPYFIVEAEY